MSAEKSRMAKVNDIRRSFRTRELDELERIKHKLRHQPPQRLERFEADLLLRELEPEKARMGAPAILTEIHKWMARHSWWLRKSGIKKAAANLEVGTKYGVSPKTVEKYAAEHESDAMRFVSEARADPLRPAGIVLQVLETVAEGYRAFGDETQEPNSGIR